MQSVSPINFKGNFRIGLNAEQYTKQIIPELTEQLGSKGMCNRFVKDLNKIGNKTSKLASKDCSIAVVPKRLASNSGIKNRWSCDLDIFKINGSGKEEVLMKNCTNLFTKYTFFDKIKDLITGMGQHTNFENLEAHLSSIIKGRKL